MKQVRFCGGLTLRDDKFFTMLAVVDFVLFLLLGLAAVLFSIRTDFISPAPFASAISAVMICVSLIVLIYYYTYQKFNAIVHGFYIWSRTIAYFLFAVLLVWLLVLAFIDESLDAVAYGMVLKIGYVILVAGMIGIFALNVNWSFTLKQIVDESALAEEALVIPTPDSSHDASNKDAPALKDELAVDTRKTTKVKDYESQVIEVSKF